MNVDKHCLAWTQTVSSQLGLVFLRNTPLLSLLSALCFSSSQTVSFIAVNPAPNLIGLQDMRLVPLLWLDSDIMHCFPGERKSLSGIKSKLRHWEPSYWEWPCRRGCLRSEQFPWIFLRQPSGCCAASTRAVPWCQRKVNSHIPCLRSSPGTALNASSGWRPADTSSHPQQGVSVVAVVTACTPPLISAPTSPRSKWLLTRLVCIGVCRSYSERGADGSIGSAQCDIKAVT